MPIDWTKLSMQPRPGTTNTLMPAANIKPPSTTVNPFKGNVGSTLPPAGGLLAPKLQPAPAGGLASLGQGVGFPTAPAAPKAAPVTSTAAPQIQNATTSAGVNPNAALQTPGAMGQGPGSTAAPDPSSYSGLIRNLTGLAGPSPATNVALPLASESAQKTQDYIKQLEQMKEQEAKDLQMQAGPIPVGDITGRQQALTNAYGSREAALGSAAGAESNLLGPSLGAATTGAGQQIGAAQGAANLQYPLTLGLGQYNISPEAALNGGASASMGNAYQNATNVAKNQANASIGAEAQGQSVGISNALSNLRNTGGLLVDFMSKNGINAQQNSKAWNTPINNFQSEFVNSGTYAQYQGMINDIKNFTQAMIQAGGLTPTDAGVQAMSTDPSQLSPAQIQQYMTTFDQLGSIRLNTAQGNVSGAYGAAATPGASFAGNVTGQLPPPGAAVNTTATNNTSSASGFPDWAKYFIGTVGGAFNGVTGLAASLISKI